MLNYAKKYFWSTVYNGPQFLADQLTLFQPGGCRFWPPFTTCPPPQFFSPSSITGGWQLNLKDDGKNNRLEERRRENNTGPIWKMCALTFWVVLRGGFVQLSCFLRLRRLPWILLLSPRPWQNSWSSPRPDVRRRDVPAIKVTKYKVNPYTSS